VVKKKTILNYSRTRAAKSLAQENYAKAIQEVMDIMSTYKRNYINNLAKEAACAAVETKMKDF
jgi:hypothetical protein